MINFDFLLSTGSYEDVTVFANKSHQRRLWTRNPGIRLQHSNNLAREERRHAAGLKLVEAALDFSSHENI